jgi:hypothetical protein
MAQLTDFPLIASRLPDMMDFVSRLAQGYRSGEIHCWQSMDERVRAFFSPHELDKLNTIAPHWREMATCAEGATLVHVMSVFTSLILCPEFQHASRPQQEMLKWIVFFHDMAKELQPGKRDFRHAFRSAAMAAETLAGVGFAVTPEYDQLIDEWVALTKAATMKPAKTSIDIQDNRKLPEILNGIERLFGRNTPAAMIVKTVLLHMSIDVVEDWPQAAPLGEGEIREYLDFALLPLLKVMMLVDNDGWALFDRSNKERYRQATLAVFERVESLISA